MKHKLAAALLIGMFASTGAQADGVVTNVQIAGIINDGTVVRITTTGAKTGGPACNTGPNFAIQVTNTTVISMVMTAYAQGKQVNIGGSGACTYHAGTENITFIQY